MKIHFADTCIELTSFSYNLTYEGQMEGTYETITEQIIQRCQEGKAKLGKGWNVFFAYQDIEQKVLKKYQYFIHAKKDVEHDIFITWFGDDVPEDSSLRTIIEQFTSKLNFNDLCRFIDIDNL